jgi:hypothetical protein
VDLELRSKKKTMYMGSLKSPEVWFATNASHALMVANLVLVSHVCVRDAAQEFPSSPVLFLVEAQEEKRSAAAQGRMVHVIATLNLTKHTGSILSVTPIFAAQSRPGLGDRVELVVRDAAGHELYRRPVSVGEATSIPQGQEQTAEVDVAISFHEQMAEIDLMLDGVVMAWYKGSQKTPQPVKRLRINSVPVSHRVALSWMAPSGSKDKLTFTVQTSDNGFHWKTVAEGLTDSTIVLSKSQATAGWARVIATTGFRNSRPKTVRLLQAQSRPPASPR